MSNGLLSWYAGRPSHCSVERGRECWEVYQPDNRMYERRVQRALRLVRGRALALRNDTDSIAKLQWALHILRLRHNAQWCEMVRDPFYFPPPPTTLAAPRTAAKVPAHVPSLGDL